MNDVQSVGFFIVGLMTLVGVVACFGIAKLVSNYMEKRAKDRKELVEAAKMFEQRIALRPKHMGARIGLGAAGDVNFEPANDRKE